CLAGIYDRPWSLAAPRVYRTLVTSGIALFVLAVEGPLAILHWPERPENWLSTASKALLVGTCVGVVLRTLFTERFGRYLRNSRESFVDSLVGPAAVTAYGVMHPSGLDGYFYQIGTALGFCVHLIVRGLRQRAAVAARNAITTTAILDMGTF